MHAAWQTNKHNFDYLSCNRKANFSHDYIAKKDLVYIPRLGLKSNCNRKQTSHGTNFRSHSSPLSTRSLHFSGVKALRRSFGFVSARSHMWIDSMFPNHKISLKTALQQSLNSVYMFLCLSHSGGLVLIGCWNTREPNREWAFIATAHA